MVINDVKLKFWIDNNYNVLFAGEHGVGKTSIVKKAFGDAGLNWLYFSAATLDPWVDFVGVPKEMTDKDGTKYIDLVRPKHFAYDQVEAIFLDELNRSHKKVRNAVMELLQFKSINGKRFNNLRIIWAAINPDEVPEDEDEYDVEKLDPAQKDRFEVQVNIPYKPDLGYFTKRYGKSTAEVGVEWWNQLDKKGQKIVSPRRLDYALGMHERGGDLRDILGDKVNIRKLVLQLGKGSFESNMIKIFESGDTQKAVEFIRDRNNFDGCKEKLVKNDKYITFFSPGITDEDKILLMADYNTYYKYVIENLDDYHTLVHSFYFANSGRASSKKNETKEQKSKRSLLSKLGRDSNKYSTLFDAIHGSYKTKAERLKIKEDKRMALEGITDQSMQDFSKNLLDAFNNVDASNESDAQTNIKMFHKIGVNVGDVKKYERWLGSYNINCKPITTNTITISDQKRVDRFIKRYIASPNLDLNDIFSHKNFDHVINELNKYCRLYLSNTNERLNFMIGLANVTPYTVDVATLCVLTHFVSHCIGISQLRTISGHPRPFSKVLSYLVNQICHVTKQTHVQVLRNIFVNKPDRHKVDCIIGFEGYKTYSNVCHENSTVNADF